MKYKIISQAEAKNIMKSRIRYKILDVRTKEEFQIGHIPNAINISHDEIANNLNLVPYKDEIILVYCRSGHRSKIASEILSDYGYTNIYEFGGIIDWDGDIISS